MIVIVIGRAAQFLLALATLRAATTLLSPEAMGQVSLVLTTTAFFAMFLVNPVGMFINRRLHAWHTHGVTHVHLMRYAGYLVVVASAAAIILPLLEATGWVNFGISISWLIALVCGSLVFNTINQTSIPSLNMLGHSRSFVALSVATLAASFLCAITLVEVVQKSAQYWVLGLLLGQALLGMVGTRILFSRLGRQEGGGEAIASSNGRQLRQLFEFAWPVALAAGLAWVQGQGYRYVVETYLGLAQLGLFVAGYGISAGLMAGFESVLTTYFQPRLYRDASDGPPDEGAAAWQRYASAIVPSLILTMVMIVLLAPELTRLFLGGSFQAASAFVVWGALAEAARVLVGVYSLIAHVLMRTRWLVLPTAVGALLAIVACLSLIPVLGASGAGIALTLAGYVVVGLLHAFLAPHVGGGVAKLLIGKAMMAGAALWGLDVLLHVLFREDGWAGILAILFLVGIAYLGALYWLLREHLVEKTVT